jgi:hypothetical protein
MAKTVLIESKPAITKVGTTGTPLEYYVQTQYQVDENNKLIPGTTKSYIAYNNSTIPGIKNFIQAAETSDGGANWSLKNGLDGKPIFGADAQRSLKEGALKTDTQQAIVSSAQNAQQPLSKEDQKQLASSTKNQSGEPGKAEAEAALAEELSQSKSLSRFKFPTNLRYPADLQIKYQDVINFSMLEYKPKTLDKTGNAGLGGINARESWQNRIIGNVYLPIPGGISDTNSVSWGSDTLTAVEAGFASIADSIISGGASAGADTAGNQAQQILENSTDVKNNLKAYFTGEAIQKSNILSRTQGAIQNPNMELLFTGPTLRPFNFTFRLSARDEADRDQIRQIIRFFKQGMAVQRSKSNLFLKAPHTFKIQYLHKEKDHPYINYIKECALQSFTVNYTPEGNYMTFADGLMTSYEISMQFQELEPIFNDDYSNDLPGKNNDSEIGY